MTACTAFAQTSRGTILIVDDDDLVRSAMMRVLRRTGYEVTDVTTGRDALALLHGGADFDLVIADITLPDLDGMSLFTRVLELEPDRVPRFVFTTRIQRASDSRFWSSCASHVLLKPFHTNELVECVRDRLLPPPNFIEQTYARTARRER